MINRNRALGFLGALAAIGMSACGTTAALTGLTGGDQGRIRFVNLVTDPARVPVNAILESVPFGVNLAYGGTTPASLPAPSTARYSAILTGSRSLVLQQTSNTAVTVATIALTIAKDEDRTVYATGGTGGAAVTNFQTVDVNTAPTATDARFRVVNVCPTCGAMDVFVTAAGADLSAATPNAAALGAPAASAYFALPGGTYQVRFLPAGTAAAARNATTPTLTIAAAAYAAGAARTLVAADNAAGAGAARGFTLTDR